jgi:hypothetical protein
MHPAADSDQMSHGDEYGGGDKNDANAPGTMDEYQAVLSFLLNLQQNQYVIM